MTPLVLTTRPARAADPLVARLAAAGLRVQPTPTVTLEPVGAGSALDAAVRDAAAGRYDMVVVTSRRGVEALAESAARIRDVPQLHGWSVAWAAVGRATADALGRHGLAEVIIPSAATGEQLARDLVDRSPAAGRRFLLPRADAADPALPSRLRAAGADVTEVVAYRTIVGPATSAQELAVALEDPELALAVVASPSAAEGLVRLATGLGAAAAARLRALPLVSIGSTTSARVRGLGLELAAEAVAPDTDALVDAVLAVVRRGRPAPAGGSR